MALNEAQIAQLRKKMSKWDKNAMQRKIELLTKDSSLFSQQELEIFLEIARKRELSVPSELLAIVGLENVETVPTQPKSEVPKEEVKTVVKTKVEKPKKSPKPKEEKKVAPVKKEKKVAGAKPKVELKKETKPTIKRSHQDPVKKEFVINGEKVLMNKSEYVRHLIKEENIRPYGDVVEKVQQAFPGRTLYYSEYNRCRIKVDGKPKKKQSEEKEG